MSRQFGGFGPNRGPDKTKVLVTLSGVVFLIASAVGVVLISKNNKSDHARTIVTRQDAEAPMKKIDVLVPTARIEQGSELLPTMFRLESRPEIGVPARAVKDFEEIRAHYARTIILPGQPLQRDYITDVKPSNVIAGKIPEGFRAVTINVNATSSVEGFARPGSRVDVIWASKIRDQQAVSVIVQNAEVLSAERDFNTENNVKPGTPVPSTVTLLVSSQDSQKIQLAVTTGSLSLVLRGDNDEKGIHNKVITLGDLMGDNNSGMVSPECEGTVKIGNTNFCVKPGGKLEPTVD